MADHAAHPAVPHQTAALDHLSRAVEDLKHAKAHHAHGEHQVAKEVAKQAIGRVQEASAHLAQAQHLYDEAEHEAHGRGKDKGSHFNANDPGDEAAEHYGTNADDGAPYEH